MKRKTEISTSGKGFYNTILILFFCSGVSALAYQVIWVKMSGLVFGVAPFAVSTVLSSFMAGLTLGSLYLGRVADKSRNPFKLFGFIEIGIGVFAFLFPFLLSKLMHSYLYLYLHFHANFYLFSLLRFVIIFALLLVPTFLMGGTLPVLSRVSILDIKMLGRRIGTLYTVNNLGAAVGAFVTGFLLIRLIGLKNGISFAAAINIAIGGVALVLSRFFDGSRSGIATVDTNSRAIGFTSVSERHNPTPDQSPVLIYILVTVFTISGFASLVYEVVWTRILSASVLSNSVYSFSTVVITFIVGLALGSLIYARFMERLRDNITLFGFIEAGIGIYALLSLPAFGRLPSIIGWISPALFGTAPSWSMCVASEFIPAFLLMIIPTTLMGMSFPMMSKIYAGSLHKLGSKIGLINGLDTAGPVLGAFAGGFLFIPLLGMQRSVLILSFVNVTMGGIVIFLSPYFRRNVKWGLIALLALILIAGNAFIPSDFNFWRSGRVPGERLVYYNEDAAATVVVREYPQGGRLNRVMEVDGTDVAGTDYMLKTTQKLQGHLPLLIHRDPKHILIVGLGSGGTTYAVSRHHVKRIDVVELVPSVVESAAKYFTEVNHGVIHDPRVTIRVDDGRNFVLTARDKYDVILTESIHPIYAGNGNLYSLEYFSLCKQRLADNGVMSVWIPLWALPERHFKMIIETFREVFPHSTLWYVANSLNRQVYLIGSKSKLEIDFESLQARVSREEIGEDLQEVGLNDPFLILGSFIMGEESLRSYTEGARINSDDHPLLEYFDYPYLEFFPVESFHIKTVYENLSSILKYKQEVTPFLVNLGDSEAVKRIKEKLSIYTRSASNTIDGIIYALQGKTKQAIQEYGKAFELNPQDKSAKRLLTHFLEYHYVNRGNELQYKGRFEEAIVSYRKALEVNPNSAIAHHNLGLSYLRKGMMEEAKQELKKALEIDSQMFPARELLNQLQDSPK